MLVRSLYSTSVVALLSLVSACQGRAPDARDSREPSSARPASVAQASGVSLRQGDEVVRARLMAGVVLCSPLARIDSLYPQARDTVVESEGQQWPAKRVELALGHWILFESPGPDETQISRISSNSPVFHTISGLHAGNTSQQTEGCILVGRGHTVHAITESRSALSEVMGSLDAAEHLEQETWLTVQMAPSVETKLA